MSMVYTLANRADDVIAADRRSRPRMAKADLRKADIDDNRRALGLAVERAMHLRGWTLKEFAAAVQRDERQCGRWFTGEERPQFDAIRAVPSLRAPMLEALSDAFDGRVEKTIHIVEQSA
jgi:hypothetical protein